MRSVFLLSVAIAIPAALFLFKSLNPGAYIERQRRIGAYLHRLGTRRATITICSALLVLLLRAALLPLSPIPRPGVPDEFGYLLLGDTFASGRLTNPPHPLWPHFETLFVLQQPTYTAIYPPVQGLILAAAERLGLHPWWGVWLTAGLMCAAMSWAFQSWLPPRWSLLATLWTCLNLTVASYWMNSYWGGSAAAIGGALLAGSAGHLRHSLKIRYVIIFGFALAILANTRPYEGFLLGGTLTTWLVFHLINKNIGWKLGLIRFALPFVLVISAVGVITGYYNWRVTGNAFCMPHLAYARQYAAAPAFLWQSPIPQPAYRHPDLQLAHLAFARAYAQPALPDKLQLLGSFYLGPMILLPLLLFWRLPRGRNLLPFVATAITTAGILLGVYLQPHYGAPLTPFVTILTFQSLRFLWTLRRWGILAGEFLVPATPVICLLYALLAPAPPHTGLRTEIENSLTSLGGSHLVIVHYEPGHDPATELVYNAADIDRAPIVWARDMGPQNEELLRYFKQRKAWLLTVVQASACRVETHLDPLPPCKPSPNNEMMPIYTQKCVISSSSP
jgi:hypothetical protein